MTSVPLSVLLLVSIFTIVSLHRPEVNASTDSPPYLFTNNNGGVAANVEVRFATATNAPVARETGQNAVGVGHLHASSMTFYDTMVMVCDKIPRNGGDCQPYPQWGPYFKQHGARMMQHSDSKRKRRFSSSFNPTSWYGSNFGNPSSWFPNTWPSVPNSWPSNSWSSWNPSGNNNKNRQNTAVLICPAQVNQSLVYQLNPNSDGYPALSSASQTCPFDQFRLWRYQSLANRGLCWVLANFGDFVLYRICTATFCKNCSNTMKDNNQSYQSGNFWGYRWRGSSGSSNMADLMNQKLCITDYRALSFWAYCPGKPEGQRIVRERIVLPVSCSCQSVKCQAATH